MSLKNSPLERVKWYTVLLVALGIATLPATLPLLPPPLEAQAGQTTTQIYDAFGFETVAVSNSAIGLTATTYAPTDGIPARRVLCTVVTDAIRYRVDGIANPTAAIGHLVAAGASFEIFGSTNIRRLRLIRVTGDATAGCTVFR